MAGSSLDERTTGVSRNRESRGGESGSRSPETLFYDGDCGVCHWAVSFVARRDPEGRAFRFAPLSGVTSAERLGDRQDLPDSIVVLDQDGRGLLRSSALIHVLSRLGGAWAWLGRLLWLVPRPVRDLGYDLFARVRHRFARPPEGVCPVLPPELRSRIDP